MSDSPIIKKGARITGGERTTLADDLKALLDGLDLQDVVLVGFSMGGGEVARYMARHGGQRVVVIPFPRFRRGAEASTVIGDDTQAVRRQCQHLVFPHRMMKRPAVNEHDRAACADVLVMEFNRLAGVVPIDFDPAHCLLLSCR